MKLQFNIWFSLFILTFIFSCKDEGSDLGNKEPDTVISVEEINLTGDRRLNSLVSLSWSGFDPDGYVIGYEISFDSLNWDYTTDQDSTFQFSINAGSDTTDIQFYIRAIDNENARDQSPDYLNIPIKNSPPSVAFDNDLNIPDSVFLVATTAWAASDLDGIETITNVQISINGKAWFDINKNKKTFSLAPSDPTVSDTVEALIYYDTDQNPDNDKVQGLVVNDTNRIYIRAIDQAGTISVMDTSLSFYLKGKQNDFLVVGGLGGSARTTYNSVLQNIGVNYDFLDLLVGNGLYRPSIWNTTFRLQLSFYDKLFFFSDESIFTNNYTNVTGLLLEFAAASLQQFANSGGKYFISTSFDHNQNIDGFVGVLPITGVSTKNYGSARLYRDSSIVSSLSNFPDLKISVFSLPGVGVFNIDSLDTEVLYEAQLSDRRPTTPWPDTKIVASGRRVNGKLTQVYFSVQLWRFDNDITKLEDLFRQIINVEFN